MAFIRDDGDVLYKFPSDIDLGRIVVGRDGKTFTAKSHHSEKSFLEKLFSLFRKPTLGQSVVSSTHKLRTGKLCFSADGTKLISLDNKVCTPQ